MLAPWTKSNDTSRQDIKKQRHLFADKGLYSQSYGLNVAMYECENWTIKKAEHKKTDLKLNIQKTMIMSSGPISSWQIDEEKVETVTDFIFLGSKIPSDSDLQP